MIRSILALSTAGLLATALHAGIPHPGLVLYGKVVDGPNLVTEGTLVWTYQPADGSPAVTAVAFLRPFDNGQGEVFSYSIQIPAEQALPGDQATAAALMFGDGGLAVTRSATLDGEPVYIATSTMGDSHVLALEQNAGTAERVDLKIVSPDDCCPGDANRDEFVTLADYPTVRSNFGEPLPTVGDADCNAFVNAMDYLAVRDHIGEVCQGTSRNTADPPPMHNGLILSLRGTGGVVPVGQETHLQFRLKTNGAAASAVGSVISYDPAMLEFVGGESNTTVFNDFARTATPRLISPGRIAITAGAINPVYGEADVAKFTFRPLAPGNASISLESGGPFPPQALDAEWEAWSCSLANSMVTLSITPATRTADWELY